MISWIMTKEYGEFFIKSDLLFVSNLKYVCSIMKFSRNKMQYLFLIFFINIHNNREEVKIERG